MTNAPCFLLRGLGHVVLRVGPFEEDGLRARPARHGVTAGEAAIRYGEGSSPSLHINDPDGDTVELKGPPNG